MEIIITEQPDKTIIKINGRIDTVSSNEFEKAISPLLNKKIPILEIDCKDMSYISSSGLRIFLLLKKSTVVNGGKLIIKDMNNDILEIFNITGFSSIFNIE